AVSRVCNPQTDDLMERARTGQALPIGDRRYSRLKTCATSQPAPLGCASILAVVVNDADAVYPVRIDPTFSDANWISMGGIPGASFFVRAMAVDGAGNLYIGGLFTAVGNVLATNIAKWNGSSWSALGSGMGGSPPIVYALAVSGSDVYAGGEFTTAGGSAANHIAKWKGEGRSAV